MASTEAGTRQIERRAVPTGFHIPVIDKDGKLVCIFGPASAEKITDADKIVVCKQGTKTGEWKLDPASNFDEALVQHIMVQPGYFVIVYNPAEEVQGADAPTHPNGEYNEGKTSVPILRYGETRTITRGSFPKWPYQTIEIKEIYQLSPDNYLRVRIVGQVVQKPSIIRLFCLAHRATRR